MSLSSPRAPVRRAARGGSRLAWALALAWPSSVLAATAAPPAESDAVARVAVLGSRDAAVVQQLDAELALLGFEVVHAEAPTRPDHVALGERARELQVVAALWVDARGQDLDLWVVDRVTGKTTLRSLPLEPGDDGARIAAVRAIDLLRASFRELEQTPPPPGPKPSVPAPVRRAMRPPPPRFVLALGPAVCGAAGGLGAMAMAALAFEAWPHRRVGVGVRALAPIAGTRARAPEGSARVLPGWLGVGPRFRLTRGDRRAVVATGLHVGPALVGMIGEASPPFVGRRDLVATALLELDVGLSIALHPRLRLWLDAAMATAIPRVGVRIASHRVAAWGLPVGTGVLGVAVAL
ncbi:MAG: hypothetical protein K1X88_16605 [Nannocystaceae bacterium]|nr:hypothetical protein [Nannocystaceae bacterium]